MTTRRRALTGLIRQRAISLALGAILAIGGLSACDIAGCPTALLEGVLVPDGATLVVQSDGGTTPVQWPGGYSVATQGSVLVVKDLFGSVKASEGDRVHLGGRMVGNPETAFGVCGDFKVDHE